jgi:beta-glucosidase
MAKLAVAWVGCLLLGMAAGWAGEVEIRVPKEEKRPPSGPKVELKDLGGDFFAVDLSELVNNDGITSEADRKDSDFDPWKQSFPAEDLPEAGKLEPKEVKALFLFPAKDPGKKNNVACSGQRVPLEGKAKQFLFLATATDGNQETKLGIEYADGQAQADLKVTDWCGQAAFGEKAGVVSRGRIAIDAGGKGNLGREDKECRMWVVAVPLAADRELKSVTLPDNPKIHLFALTVAR